MKNGWVCLFLSINFFCQLMFAGGESSLKVPLPTIIEEELLILSARERLLEEKQRQLDQEKQEYDKELAQEVEMYKTICGINKKKLFDVYYEILDYVSIKFTHDPQALRALDLYAEGRALELLQLRDELKYRRTKKGNPLGNAKRLSDESDSDSTLNIASKLNHPYASDFVVSGP